jgi:3-deoxy-D-manno-octulosonate 8-phosphate phosphatase (KDO 8-P phosphatase)
MQFSAPDALDRARRVKLMVFDVDGVLTDGRLWYASDGREHKAFHAFDGHGIKMLSESGVRCAILSGRKSPTVAKRAKEMGLALVRQGIADKRDEFGRMLKRLRVDASAAGYMGDDLVDVPVLRRAGFACAPREAPEVVRHCVHYVPSAAAGGGAVRELCEYIMRSQGTLERLVREYFS